MSVFQSSGTLSLSQKFYYFMILSRRVKKYRTELHENRGSYMSAHVLLTLLNELRKRDKMRGLPSILSFSKQV